MKSNEPIPAYALNDSTFPANGTDMLSHGRKKASTARAMAANAVRVTAVLLPDATAGVGDSEVLMS